MVDESSLATESIMCFRRLSAGMHLRLLVALCNDVTDCTGLRNEMTARIDEILQIQTEFRQKQTEVRKLNLAMLLTDVHRFKHILFNFQS